MNYRISALDLEPFQALFGATDDLLSARNIHRMTVDARPGYPCRVTLEDAMIGESVLLLNYEHLPLASPYRSAHAIFVRENATESARFENEIPELLSRRQLSVRSFDAAGMMLDAEVCEGRVLDSAIERLLGDSAADYLHVHNAGRGCYLARIDGFS